VSFTQAINLGKRYVCKRGSQQWLSQPKNWGAKMLEFRRITLFFGKTPLNAQNDSIF